MVIDVAKKHALKRRHLSWFIDSGDVVSGFDLQVSRWNARKGWGFHHINLGCFIREIDLEIMDQSKIPSVSAFHIRTRAGELLPGQYEDNLPCLCDWEEPNWDIFDQYEHRFTSAGITREILEAKSKMSKIPPALRREQIEELLGDFVVPMVQKLSTPAGILDVYNNGSLPKHCFRGGFGRVVPYIAQLSKTGLG